MSIHQGADFTAVDRKFDLVAKRTFHRARRAHDFGFENRLDGATRRERSSRRRKSSSGTRLKSGSAVSDLAFIFVALEASAPELASLTVCMNP
jgi:hypothetical protein